MSQNYSVKPRKIELAKVRQELLDVLISGDQIASTELVDKLIEQR